MALAFGLPRGVRVGPAGPRPGLEIGFWEILGDRFFGQVVARDCVLKPLDSIRQNQADIDFQRGFLGALIGKVWFQEIVFVFGIGLVSGREDVIRIPLPKFIVSWLCFNFGAQALMY
jgi:hypothetical protein